MARGRAALAACLLLIAAAAPAALLGSAASPDVQNGTAVGRPSIDLTVPTARISAEEVVTVEAYLTNDARIVRGGTLRDERQVGTARNVTVRPLPDRLAPRVANAVEFRTGAVPVGDVPPGAVESVRFTVAVGSLPPGRYAVPFAVTYSYVPVVPLDEPPAVRTRTEVVTASLIVDERPRLRLAAAPNQSLAPGVTDSYRFEVTNVGSAAASEVGLVLSADNNSVYFGTRLDRRGRTAVYFDELAPGETATVTVRMGADDATLPGRYLVSGSATYRGRFGVVRRADWLAAGVAVDGENYSASPAPSRTITAIPASKSRMASADSSARPTPRMGPSS